MAGWFIILLARTVLSCKLYTDTYIAHYKIYQSRGQVIHDHSGNNYFGTLGTTAESDGFDGIFTDRGVRLESGDILTLAHPGLSSAGLFLASSFTVIMWAMANGSHTIFSKGTLTTEVSGTQYPCVVSPVYQCSGTIANSNQ